jgi:hypothetical protein
VKRKQKPGRRRSGGQLVPAVHIDSVIHTIRGEKVILDADLAHLYGVSTKALNQAVKRNLDRFPADFLIQLTKEEWAALRLQTATLNNETNRSQIVTGSQH